MCVCVCVCVSASGMCITLSLLPSLSLSPQVELFMKKEGELLKEVLSASTIEGTTEVLTITSL